MDASVVHVRDIQDVLSLINHKMPEGTPDQPSSRDLVVESNQDNELPRIIETHIEPAPVRTDGHSPWGSAGVHD